MIRMTEKQKITVNGAQLHYKVTGDGPYPILCIPGSASLGFEWTFSSQLEHFGRSGSGYTIVGFDQRGFGYSIPPHRDLSIHPEHHLKKDADDAHELMKLLGYSKFSVIGWCGGGVTAISLATQYPAAVDKIILSGTRTYYTEANVQLVEKWRKFENWNSDSLIKLYAECYGADYAIKLWNRFADFVVAQFGKDICTTEEMAQVSCPTLVVHGEKDYMASRAHADHILSNIPNSRLKLFAEAGHCPFHTCAAEFNDTVDSFLKEGNH